MYLIFVVTGNVPGFGWYSASLALRYVHQHLPLDAGNHLQTFVTGLRLSGYGQKKRFRVQKKTNYGSQLFEEEKNKPKTDSVKYIRNQSLNSGHRQWCGVNSYPDNDCGPDPDSHHGSKNFTFFLFFFFLNKYKHNASIYVYAIQLVVIIFNKSVTCLLYITRQGINLMQQYQ